MLRVNTKPRKRNSPRIAEKSAPGFLQWLRGRECVFQLLGKCEGKMEAAHLDFAGGKGIGTKVADRFAIPMCSWHHRLQHTIGWRSFLNRMNANSMTLVSVAEQYWRAWPGRAAWERKLSDA